MAHARILVVEDEAITAMHIRRALQDWGYVVLGVLDTAEEAVTKAAELNPDLMLMDITLKGRMDGVEAVGIINSRLDIPVIYLTAHADERTVERAKTTKPFGYLVKPIDVKVLRPSIEMALYKHQNEGATPEGTETFLEVARILAQPVSPKEKATGILKAMARVSNADLTTLRVPDGQNQTLQLIASAGPTNLDQPETLPLDKSIAGVAYQLGKPAVVNDYLSHPLAEPAVAAQGVRSLVSLPIKTDGHILGAIDAVSRKSDHFTPKLVKLLTAIGDGIGTF